MNKKVLLIGAIVAAIAIVLSSCSTSRRSGCPDTWFVCGYK